jgi:nitroimidazol reductase NimA-like FMN-containing flavoprotein (pyridoxamine 5'-phosphate oxidase superfamily)
MTAAAPVQPRGRDHFPFQVAVFTSTSFGVKQKAAYDFVSPAPHPFEGVMIGQLSAPDIEALLYNETLARIGCHANGRTYVVPVTYVYDGNGIISYSADGLKLWMMRENPAVCVEVDRVETLASWRSVIASGTFQELNGDDAARGRQQLSERLQRVAPGLRTHSHGLDPHAASLNVKRFVVYRIDLGSKSGRFERPD